MKIYRISILLFILSACSNQQIYDDMQRNNQFECYNLPVAQQEDCVESFRSMSFEEYKRERDKTLTDSSVK